MRRARDGGGVVRMLAIAGHGCRVRQCRLQRDAGRRLDPVLAVKLKAEGPAEGGKGTLGAIGLGGLECNIVHFSRRGPSAFAGTMALADDCGSLRPHGDAHLGGIDSEEGAAVLASKNAAGIERLPAPAIKAEDAIRLG